MVRHLMIAACAMALAACGQGNGVPGGVQQVDPNAPNAPSQQTPQVATQQASLSAEERAQLESLVRGYLDAAQQAYAQGFRPAAGINDEVTSLQPGRDHRWQINLTGGTGYRFVGGCDNECSNLDFELLDNSGAVVASDMLPDDVPVVNFTPAANGRFTLRILMQTCTVAPCYAGARVLTQ